MFIKILMHTVDSIESMTFSNSENLWVYGICQEVVTVLNHNVPPLQHVFYNFDIPGTNVVGF